MNKAEFVEKQRQARGEWEALVAQVPADRMTQAGVVGQWSMKDLIAHIAWYEQEMVGVIQQRALRGSDWWLLPTDERNAKIYAQYREMPLDDVLAFAKSTYQQFIAQVLTLTDEELQDARHFEEMPSEWIAWQVIASNCFEHYAQHMDDVRGWIENSDVN